MPQSLRDTGNLWLAKALWDLGAVQFGDFTVGRTTLHSPVYVNLRLLISNPRALQRAGRVIHQDVQTLQRMLNPRVQPFQRVSGILFGGLHLAMAHSLASKVPLIYIHPAKERRHGVSLGEQDSVMLWGVTKNLTAQLLTSTN